MAGAHAFLPVDRAALAVLHDTGRLARGDGEVFVADATDEDAAYDALVAADEVSPERLVVEVDGEGIDGVSIDHVVAVYVALAWYGVQEIRAILAD